MCSGDCQIKVRENWRQSDPKSVTDRFAPLLLVCFRVKNRPLRKIVPRCQTGWSEEADTDGLDLPDEEKFDYDDFVKREFGDKSRCRAGCIGFGG